jgi:cytochrome c biogenesis protein CcdA
MLRLLGLAISIGLADSLNPSTIGPALYLASGPRPCRAVLRFAAGAFAVFLFGGVVLALGPGRAILALVPKPGPTARYILETVAGVAMLGAAGVVWIRRHRLSRRAREGSDHRRRRSPALMGVVISAIEFPTAFPYFAVVVAIVGSGLNIGGQLLLLVIYNVCFVLPLLAIALTLVVAGDQAERMLTRARDYARAHWPVFVAIAGLLAGVFVTVLGVTGLVSASHSRVGRLSRRLRHIITRP